MHQNAFLKYLATEKRFSQHTVVAYKNDLVQFFEFLKTTYETEDAAEVTNVMLRSYVVHLMEQNLVPTSINRKISTLRAFYRYLRKCGITDKNPTAAISAVKKPKVIVKTVSQTEMENLLDEDWFEATLQGKRDKAIIELLYGTGIRRSELINLQPKDINWAEQTLSVTGKRDKMRIIPLPLAAIEAVEIYINEKAKNRHPNIYVFETDKGKKLYPALVYHTVKRYLRIVSTITKKSPHVLRHTYATHLLNNGASLNDIKELLGHANLSATQVYTHNSFEKLKSVYNQSHPREAKK